MKAVFFTDRDLGKRFPQILLSAGLTVERHDDLFPPDCSDEQWMKYVGENGRIAITHNYRIRYMPNEIAAVNRHGVSLLVVIGKARLKYLAQNFIATMPRIVTFLSEHQAPFIAKIYRPTPSEIQRNPKAVGSVALWYPKQISVKR